MKLLRVGAATLNQTALAWERNLEHITQVLAEARRRAIDVLCLPELCITGYGCEDAFLAPSTARTALEILVEIAEHTEGMIVAVGLPVYHKRANYNACAVIDDRRIVGFVAKHALAGDGVHYEPRWFKPWPSGVRADLTVGAARYPIGDLRFDCGGVRIGFEICEDAWIAERPGAHLALDAVDLVLNPSASHFAFGKQAVRRRLALEGSRAFGVGYLYANLLGNDAGRVIYDGDALIAVQGELVAEGRRFAFGDWALVDATFDLEVQRHEYARRSSSRPRPEDPRELWVHSEHRFGNRHAAPPLKPSGKPRAPAGAEQQVEKEEEFARAVALGLVDYLRKSGSRGFVVSLSGGADSAAVACLVALGLRFAAAELGLPRLTERLAHALSGQHPTDEKSLTRALLTTVYQATRNSSAVTRKAASALAAELGADSTEHHGDGIEAGYTKPPEHSNGRALSWDRDDLALQNIQARARAPGVWMIANLREALLLSTGNRSEAAVGYATMDGDTAGGLCPIGGIDKAFLRRWLRWLERQGPAGLGAFPSLALVNDQTPTAELRPKEAAQTDEADLMPYEVLDAIERAAIFDKRPPEEVYEVVRASFPAANTDDLLHWVERFFVLFSRNQWKRERYAPSFHVDDANLDPKTWCRFPILSGGFERELGALRAELARAQHASEAKRPDAKRGRA